MKRNLTLIGLLLASIAVVSCAAFKNGSPPTAAEQQLFSVVTNYVTVVTTNAPTVAGQPPTVTTNLQPTYAWTPNQTVKDVGTGLSLIPGYGGLASTALALLAGAWGWFRSSKNGTTAATLAQEVESVREFIKALPNGAAYDNALVQYLQSHQAETGTIQNVLSVLENDVSSPDAKMAAQQIIATLQALNPNAVPPGTVVKV